MDDYQIRTNESETFYKHLENLLLKMVAPQRGRINAHDAMLHDFVRGRRGQSATAPPVIKNPENPVIVERYELLDKIGHGAFGRVWLAMDKQQQDEFVAIKELKIKARDSPRDFRNKVHREVHALWSLEHPNIVKLHEAFVYDDRFFLVMDYHPQNLWERLREGLAPSEIRMYMRDILTGLKHVHDVGFLHKDIKPANIMVSSGDRAMLTDFGAAAFVNGTILSYGEPEGTFERLEEDKNLRSTFEYIPPEAIADVNSVPTKAADVWAVGMVFLNMIAGDNVLYIPPGRSSDWGILPILLPQIYTILGPDPAALRPSVPLPTSQAPFFLETLETHLTRYKDRMQDQYWLDFDDYNAQAKDLLRKLLNYDQDLRVTAGEALKDPFFV